MSGCRARPARACVRVWCVCMCMCTYVSRYAYTHAHAYKNLPRGLRGVIEGIMQPVRRRQHPLQHLVCHVCVCVGGVCVCACACVFIWYAYVCRQIDAQMDSWMVDGWIHTCTYEYTYMHARTHAHKQTYAYTYTLNTYGTVQDSTAPNIYLSISTYIYL